jgi:phage baseplate assembly protein W
MAIQNTTYSDLDLRFLPQPGTKDVSLSYDEQSVIRSVKNLILTSPFERPFQPLLGSQINKLLFEPINPLTAGLLEDEIVRTINNYEPRASVANISINAYPDQDAYQVSMFFYIGNNTTPTGINIILKRAK